MRLTAWLARHDPGYLALRRAARTAVVMPALFAFGSLAIRNADVAVFCAFGSFAMLMLVDFGGPMRDRIQAQVWLAVSGAVLVALGTLVSKPVWLAVVAMAIVAFAVLFAGTVSSVLASASTSLLLAFILPVTLPGTVASLAPRLLGWTIASGAGLVAISLLWPAPVREPLRAEAASACRALAGRLRADCRYVRGNGAADLASARPAAAAAADDAVASVQRVFLASPSRPTGLSTSARTVVRLVDELLWLDAQIAQSTFAPAAAGSSLSPLREAALRLKLTAAEVLEEGSALLQQRGGDPRMLEAAASRLAETRAAVEAVAISAPVLPGGRADAEGAVDGGGPEGGAAGMTVNLISALDPGFRAQELSHAVEQVAQNIALTARAERRTWWQRALGRQPGDVLGPVAAAEQRASGYFTWHSVWLRNSIRGAAALAIAVLLADISGVQHSFWVVLGTLSVLRSNALSTGQTALRGVLGTAVGVVVGAALLLVIGTNAVALWALLPIAILVAGVAPAAISFAAGQAAFTITLVLLFNIIAPTGWTVGLLRIEDIAIGCAVSLVVGVLFWPRGASAALRRALAEAYREGVRYLTASVAYGLARCTAGAGDRARPVGESLRAAAASRRLDDTFRTYLAERGTKRMPLAEVSALVTGVAGVRLAGDAIVDVWQGQDAVHGDIDGARNALGLLAERLTGWYGELGADLVGRSRPPEPLDHDLALEQRLADAVAEKAGDGSMDAATAIRVLWSADYLDVVRRLQGAIVGPAHALRASGPSR